MIEASIGNLNNGRLSIKKKGYCVIEPRIPERKLEKVRALQELVAAVECEDEEKILQLRPLVSSEKNKPGRRSTIPKDCKKYYRLTFDTGEITKFIHRQEVRDYLGCSMRIIEEMLKYRKYVNGCMLEKVDETIYEPPKKRASKHRLRTGWYYVAISPNGKKYASTSMRKLARQMNITKLNLSCFNRGPIKRFKNAGWELKTQAIKKEGEGEYTWL